LFFYFFWPSRADARKLQQKQEESVSSPVPVPTEVRGATALAVQDQRKALKFGFSSKGGTSKVCLPSLYLCILDLYYCNIVVLVVLYAKENGKKDDFPCTCTYIMFIHRYI